MLLERSCLYAYFNRNNIHLLFFVEPANTKIVIFRFTGADFVGAAVRQGFYTGGTKFSAYSNNDLRTAIYKSRYSGYNKALKESA